MNFPMENTIVQFFYWLFNTPGIGGIIVCMLAVSFIFSYSMVLRWVSKGGQAKEIDTFSYPTISLHDHKE
jgi:hypothetical protein